MNPLLLGAALAAGSTFLSGMAAKNSAMKQMAQEAQWESEQIQRQSLNTMIRNAYNAAFLQMQLGQQKMQRAQYGADIRTAGLAQAGQARLAAASTGSIGASVDSILSDIQMRTDAALAANQDAYEKAIEQYNYELAMQTLNTEQSAPAMRQYKYTGPSTAGLLTQSLFAGVMQAGGTYLMNRMQLGLGPAPAQPASSITLGSGLRPPLNFSF